MDVREKLVDLLDEAEEWAEHKCDELDCEKCPAGKMKGNCVQLLMVDRLIAHGVTVQEWISVKDRLPDNKENDWVLAQVVEDNGFMHIPKVMEYRQQRNDWYEETFGWLSEHNGAFTVTHWMPLPQPPK